MPRIFFLLLLFCFIACSEQFRIIKSKVNQTDGSYSITTTPIELSFSGMTDIYSYKIFVTFRYNHYTDKELYSMTVKHTGISLLNLEQAKLEINDNTIELISDRPAIIKQDGVESIAEIYSFNISKDNILSLINEVDSRLIFKTGKRRIDMPFDEKVKIKIKNFLETTIAEK